MQDGFKLVKRKRKTKFANQTQDLNSPDALNRKLQTALEEFESSQFCFEIIQGVEKCLKSRNVSSVSEILCYGIGSFSENKSSLHQLAALCVLKRHYSSNVKVYDPIFNFTEVKLLEESGFTVLTENEEGKRKLTDTNQGTVVFLPHCPKQLTNNFLWANWNTALCYCVLIANSFSKIIQDNTTKALQESAEYILKIKPRTTEIPLEDCYSIDNTFNDTSVHCFDCDNSFFFTTLNKEPSYSGDIELITKDSPQDGG